MILDDKEQIRAGMHGEQTARAVNTECIVCDDAGKQGAV